MSGFGSGTNSDSCSDLNSYGFVFGSGFGVRISLDSDSGPYLYSCQDWHSDFHYKTIKHYQVMYFFEFVTFSSIWKMYSKSKWKIVFVFFVFLFIFLIWFGKYWVQNRNADTTHVEMTHYENTHIETHILRLHMF